MSSIIDPDLLAIVGGRKESKPKGMEAIAERLHHFREISDALWNATATVGVAMGSLESLRETLAALNDAGDGSAAIPPELTGIGCLSKLSSFLKNAEFRGVNLINGGACMKVLTQADEDQSGEKQVFQTIPTFNLGLDGGPYEIRIGDERTDAVINVHNGYNPITMFGNLDRVRMLVSNTDGISRVIAPDFTWTRTPKAMCAVLSAMIRNAFPEADVSSVTFDGRQMKFKVAEGMSINAICLQSEQVGALNPLRKLLAEETPNSQAIRSAAALGVAAIDDALAAYKVIQEDIGHMEELTLNILERVALLTVMPPEDDEEKTMMSTLSSLQVSNGKHVSPSETAAEILGVMPRMPQN